MAIPESDLVLPGMPGPWARQLAFLDTETTGLKPSVCNVIDVAVIRNGLPWQTRIKISEYDERRGDSESRGKSWREVTGYTREKWSTAPNEAKVADELALQLHGCVLVGHNVDFDVGFLSALLERHGISWRSVFSGSMIDTYPLCKSVLGRMGLKKFSLNACCEFLGLETEGDHEALGGAMRCRQLYVEFVRRVWEGFAACTPATPTKMAHARAAAGTRPMRTRELSSKQMRAAQLLRRFTMGRSPASASKRS